MREAAGTADPYLCIHAVSVYVRDLERSIRFYVDILGFRLAFDSKIASGQRAVAVAPPDGSVVLSLVQPPSESTHARMIGRATQVVLVTENLPSVYSDWRKRGVKFKNTPRLRRVSYEPLAEQGGAGAGGQAAWGGMFVRFEDPDRNSFSLVSFDEVSRALEVERRAAAEKAAVERRAAQNSRSPCRCRRGSSRSVCRRCARSNTPAPACRRAVSAATITTSSTSVRNASVSSSATSPARACRPRC